MPIVDRDKLMRDLVQMQRESCVVPKLIDIVIDYQEVKERLMAERRRESLQMLALYQETE